MLTFDEAAVILDDLIEELPDGIYDELNGGVNLIEDCKTNEYGDHLMGMYHVNEMGRYIEIYYGSFVDLYGDMDQDEFTAQLRKVLHHELTHHIENLAGDRTLEKWDAEQEEKRRCGYVEADSILFVDEDGTALAPMAAAMFRTWASSKCGDVKVGAACLSGFSGTINPAAAAAAQELGVSMLEEQPAQTHDVLLKDYDAMLCMTMDQADRLYDMFPQFDDRIMCLGVTDIKPPVFKKGWTKTAKRIQEEIEELINELCEEDE